MNARVFVVALFLVLGSVSASLHANKLATTNSKVEGGYTPPSAALLLHEGFLSKLAVQIKPLLEQIALNYTIEGNTTDHYSYQNVTLSKFDLGSLNVSVAAPNVIVLGFTNVTLTIPWTDFSIYEKILGKKIGCNGEFSGTSSGTDLVMYITLQKDPITGKLSIPNVGDSVDFGSIDLQHKIDGKLCDLAEKFLSFLLGDLNKLATKMVKEMLPKQMATIIKTKANTLFSSLPITLAGQPTVTDNSMELDMVFLAVPGSSPDIVPPSFDTFPPRDMEVYIPDTTFNDLLMFANVAGLFNQSDIIPQYQINTSTTKLFLPQVYSECPNCPFELKLAAPVTPKVQFSQATGVSVEVGEMLLSMLAHNPQNNVSNFIFDLALNVTISIQNLTVVGSNGTTFMFQIAVPTFSVKIVNSAIGPIDIGLISGAVSFLIKSVAVPGFNKNFKGIAVPSIGGLSVEDIVFDVNNGQFGIATNVNFPPSPPTETD